MLPLPPIFTLFPYTTLFRSLFGSDGVLYSRIARFSVVTGMGHCRGSQWSLGIHPGRLASLQEGKPRNSPTRRSEEHTSELQSHSDLVCRLLLEKKKKKINRE